MHHILRQLVQVFSVYDLIKKLSHLNDFQGVVRIYSNQNPDGVLIKEIRVSNEKKDDFP